MKRKGETMNIKITSILKNLKENSIIKEEAIAKKEKNKITYKTKEFNYILKIISPKQIIINRKSADINCTMYFNLNKTTSSDYTINNEYNLEINIKTTLLKKTENKIKIQYTVIEAETNYEYQIEMSEIK